MSAEAIAAIRLVWDIGKTLFGGYNKNKKEYKAQVNDKLLAYQGSLKMANDMLEKADATYNSMKDNITSKYGSDVFSILERQYNYVNNIKGTAITNGGISKYDTEKNSKGEEYYANVDTFGMVHQAIGYKNTTNTEQVSTDYESDYGNRKFNTNTMIDEDKNSLIDVMYNSLSSGDTALAQQLRLSGNQLAAILGTAQDQVAQSMRSGNDTIKQSAMQLHSQNLSNALEIANARSTMASSGIRNTGTGNANESLTQLQADITNAYYVFNIQTQATQLRNEIYNSQKTASLSAYETRASIENKQRQAYEDSISTYKSGAVESESYVKESKDNADEANEYQEALQDLLDTSWLDMAFGNY